MCASKDPVLVYTQSSTKVPNLYVPVMIENALASTGLFTVSKLSCTLITKTSKVVVVSPNNCIPAYTPVMFATEIVFVETEFKVISNDWSTGLLG